MIITDRKSGDSVELTPISYQFGTTPEDEYDANWLMIRGRVRVGDDRWNFVDACLLVWEARELGAWLERVGNGGGEIAAPDDDGEATNQVTFIEPNLAMAVVAKTTESATMRFSFSHESGRPDLMPEIVKEKTDMSADLTVALSSITQAAAEWRAELRPFPERKVSGR